MQVGDRVFDADLLMAVTTALGDVMLGPRGTKPSDLAKGEGAERSRA
jgi:hypothetical protein